MCSQLEEIDASAITGTDEVSFLLPYDFANGCYNLKTLKLPPFTSITDMSSTSTPPIFGYTCLLDHIEMHTITPVVDLPRFCYSTYKGVQVFSPQVYISVTANSDLFPTYYNDWPVGPMFVAGNGATVKPQFYCDAYTPSENYVCNTATYNIPGGAMHNYSEARNAGCTVRETYSVEFQNVNDYMRVVISRKADAPADVREFYVSFDGGTPKRIGYEGSAVSDTSYDDIRKIRISYRLNDIEMATDYPMGHWTGASVDGIEIDEDDTEAVYYNLQGIRIDNPGNGLYIRRTAKGSDVVRL